MIYVNSCGHDSHHPKPCNIEHKQGVPDYLILLIKRESWIYLNGEKHTVAPNFLICFPPDTYIHYGCDAIGYNDDWIHFIPDGREYDILQRLLPPMCQVLQPYNFHRLSEYVRMLSDIFHGHSCHKEESMDAFLHIFLYALQDELATDFGDSSMQKYYQAFSGLRTQVYNNPANNWSIPALAASLALSLSYFQHLYKQFFGCSCQQDIISARLELAKYYLKGSDMSIRSLSDFCGYDNELHFMRQFKKFVGMTPTEYRQKCAPIDAHAKSPVTY